MPDVRDGLFVGGVLAVVIGVAQWSGPAAWVLVGLVGLGLWAWPMRRR